MSLQNSNINLCINSTFTYMQITYAVGTDAPPYHHRDWFLHLVWMVFLASLTHRIRYPFSPKNKLKCGLVWPENMFPLCFEQTHMPLGPEFLRKINKCIIKFQVAFLDAEADCADNDFPKYSWAHVAMSIMIAWRFLKQYRLRARWTCAFCSGYRYWPLRTNISPDSLNLFTILWTVDGERPKFFAILCWETFFELTDNSLTKFGTKWWTTTHPCLQRLSLWWMLLLCLILITCYQLNC